MADAKVKITFEGRDRATDDIKGIDRSLNKMQGSALKGVVNFAKFTAAIIAAKKAFDFAKDTAMMAAQADQIKASLQSMAVAAGTTADAVVSQMQAMSGGTINQLDIMESASKAALLGIPLEQLGDLMQVARASATALGTDVGQMFDDLATGIGRQSKMILDNLGINISAKEAYDAYAQTLGKTAAQLTDNEKRQGFLNAVLQDGERIMKMVGEAGSQMTATEPMQIFKAAIDDAKIALGEGLFPLFNKGALMAANMVRDMIPYLENLPDTFRAVGDLIQVILQEAVSWDMIKQNVAEMAVGFFAVWKQSIMMLPRLWFMLFNILKDAVINFGEVLVSVLDNAWARVRNSAAERFNEGVLAKIFGTIETVAVPKIMSFGEAWDETMQEAAGHGEKFVTDLVGGIKEQIDAYGGMLAGLAENFADNPAVQEALRAFEEIKQKALEAQAAAEAAAAAPPAAAAGPVPIDYSAQLEQLDKLYAQTDEAKLGELYARLEQLNEAFKIEGIPDDVLNKMQVVRQMTLEQIAATEQWANEMATLGMTAEEYERRRSQLHDALLSDMDQELQSIDMQYEALFEVVETEAERLKLTEMYAAAQDEVLAKFQAQAAEAQRMADIEATREGMGALLPAAEAVAPTEVGALMGIGESIGMEVAGVGMGIIGSLMEMLMAIDSVAMVLDPFKTILQVMFSILEPLINQILAPIIGVLVIIGQTLAQAITPILQALAPILEIVAQIFYISLRPALMLVAPLFEILATVLEALTPVIEIVAKAFDIVSRPIEVLANLLQWVGRTIRVAIHNLVEFIKHPFRKRKRDIWSYPSLRDVFEPLRRPLLDFGDMLTEIGTDFLAEEGAPLPEEAQTVIYGGETTVQRAPDIYIYQTFQGPIVGEGGTEEFGRLTADALERYAGIGGLIHIEEAIAPQTE